MSSPTNPRMMLGFVVRRCTVDLGHEPTAAEFALWANRQGSGSETRRLFGKPITEDEAKLILRHRARLVTARSATTDEQWIEPDEAAVTQPAHSQGVISLELARARRTAALAARKKRTR